MIGSGKFYNVLNSAFNVVSKLLKYYQYDVKPKSINLVSLNYYIRDKVSGI